MNILIADDSATNRNLLRAQLESEKFTAFEAADGVEALNVLDREKIDAIISDILMPNMDGYRLCHELRRSDKLKLLPFLVYTSTYHSPADEKLALDLGADKFIRKPASLTAMLDALYDLTHEDKYDEPRKVKPRPELALMKQYSERLVAQLEERNIELEKTRETLRQANEELEQRVREHTAQLAGANQELEAFRRCVAHDLQSPLRAIDGFCRALQEECSDQLPTSGRQYLRRVEEHVQRMRQVIEGLLNLAHVGFLEMVARPVNLSDLAAEIVAELRRSQPEHAAEFRVAPHLVARGDRMLLRAMLANLLGNAWKFTAKRAQARIEFGLVEMSHDGEASPTQNTKIPRRQHANIPIFFVRDNGAGFDTTHADKLFNPFQRLRSGSEFHGNGTGLATVQRIIARHGGLIWAEGKPGEGATFYFTL
ncbi:MAG: response regulator [Verrucomicrobia bacterium]|nr:response regulator [Verrucomicrobiota bacterium]